MGLIWNTLCYWYWRYCRFWEAARNWEWDDYSGY